MKEQKTEKSYLQTNFYRCIRIGTKYLMIRNRGYTNKDKVCLRGLVLAQVGRLPCEEAEESVYVCVAPDSGLRRLAVIFITSK
jgi:hypothetical protein